MKMIPMSPKKSKVKMNKKSYCDKCDYQIPCNNYDGNYPCPFKENKCSECGGGGILYQKVKQAPDFPGIMMTNCHKCKKIDKTQKNKEENEEIIYDEKRELKLLEKKVKEKENIKEEIIKVLCTYFRCGGGDNNIYPLCENYTWTSNCEAYEIMKQIEEIL